MLEYASPATGGSLDPKIAAILKNLYRRRTVLDRLIRSLELYSRTEIVFMPAEPVKAGRPASRQTVAH